VPFTFLAHQLPCVISLLCYSYLHLQSCSECKEVLKISDVVVRADRAGAERYWHPACFICAECKELLVDLIYFYHDDKIYCGRHYCELHKPRCAACDEVSELRSIYLVVFLSCTSSHHPYNKRQATCCAQRHSLAPFPVCLHTSNYVSVSSWCDSILR